MALIDCGLQYVKATTLKFLSSKAVPAKNVLAARPDFFDSDPIIVEWTPAAEAAAPDAPCRHLTMEDVSALVDHLHISWVELEALAISKAPPALQRKRRPTQPQISRHCEVVSAMGEDLILCKTEPPESAANVLVGSFTVQVGTHKFTGGPNITVYG